MSRVKISEYRAKVMLYRCFGGEYTGVAVDLNKNLLTQLKGLPYDNCVVKVDQAIKKRNKLGLVFVKRTLRQAVQDLEFLKKKGYDWALVEPFVAHESDDERFIALSRGDKGIELQYSATGGVDIESHQSTIETTVFDNFELDTAINKTKMSNSILQMLYELLQTSHMTYLEINPALIIDGKLIPLDAAVEVDSTAKFFIRSNVWGDEDIRDASRLSRVEKAVEDLAENSPASFSLKVLNENGSIFLLLSGGGASIVVADEFAAQGLYDKIANYGEYSGNPNADETYIYTKQLLELLLQSKSHKKILFIGGGTANFTDIASTFKGVLKAMEEVKAKLKSQKVSVFVRRGGPNQEKGLSAMRQFLDSAGLKNTVCGPDVAIAKLVKDAAREVK